MAEEEEEKHEEKKEEHKGEEHGKGKGLLKNKWVWVAGGVAIIAGAAFFLMGGGGGQQQQQATPQTSGANTNPYPVDSGSMYGAGGTVGSAGPSWYNANAPENMDYWPYVPVSTSGSSSGSSGSGKHKGSGSGSGSGSSSSGGTTKSGGSSSGSHGGSGRTGGSTHGKKPPTSTGSSGHKASSGGQKSSHSSGVKPNPHGGGAHGYVYTAKAGDTLSSLQHKFWPTSSGSNAQGNIFRYGNNNKLIKSYLKSGAIDKNGRLKAGTRINA